MAKQKIARFKKSKKPGHWFYTIIGKNGEKMNNSAPLKSKSWMYELMAYYKSLGYTIKREGV